MGKRVKMSYDTKKKISGTKKENYTVKYYNKKCKYCEVDYVSNHMRGLFCSSKCMDKNRYHNGQHGVNQKKIVFEKRHERYKEIGNCDLCGIEYKDIKSIKDLGSTMYNGASIFMIDHIIPKAKNGSNKKENTRYLCWFCNMTRKDMDSKYDEAIKQSALAFWKEISKLYT